MKDKKISGINQVEYSRVNDTRARRKLVLAPTIEVFSEQYVINY
ncbi:MAG TPA: hypothetical protein VH481_05115 [Nitrososphaeraceae archaeon]